MKYPFPKEWKFWIARYGENDGTKSKEPAFKDWTIWQYTSRGEVDGIEGFVDLNESKESPVSPDLPHSEVFTPGTVKYLSQRNPAWKDEKLGSTTIGENGCTITSLSSISSWYNCYHDPSFMAKYLRFTPDGRIYWQSIEEQLCFKFVWRFYKYDKNLIDDVLKHKTKTCLLNIRNAHWVLALGKSGNNYRTMDPWPTPNGATKIYSPQYITGGTILDLKN